MDCLEIIVKPKVEFWSLKDLARLLEKRLPKYQYVCQDEDSILVEPTSIEIQTPYCKALDGDENLLVFCFFIRDSWIYDKREYERIRQTMSDFCHALETDEWWYSSEMQSDWYSEYTLKQIVDFLATGEHMLEYEETLNMKNYDSQAIWFVHDKMQES